jgi:MFS family permease
VSRRWTRPAGWRLLLLHFVLVQGLAAVIRPTVSYRAIELGVPVSWLGVLAAGFAVAPLLVAVSVGTVVDRRGERPVLLAGAGLLALCAVGFVVVTSSAWWLLFWSVLLGLGHLLSVVAGQSIVASRLAPADADRGFGVYTFAASVGQALGPAVVTVLGGGQALPDTLPIFACSLAAALLLLGVTAAVARGAGRSRGAMLERPGGEFREALTVPGLPRAVLVSLVVLSSVDLLGVYLPALGAERGLAARTVGSLLLVRAVASMVTRFALGAIVARWGRTPVLAVGTAAAGLATAALAIPLPAWALVAVVVVAGLGLGIGQPLTLSWVATVAPPRIRGTALSLRITGNRLGQTLLPAGMGLVASAAGAGGVFVASGAVLLMAAAVSVPRTGPDDV